MSWHGQRWKLVWRDITNNVHYAASNSADPQEAQRELAKLALPRAQAMVKALKAIIDGTPYQKETGAAGDGKARNRAEHGASRRPVRHDAAIGGDRGTTKRGGGR